MPKRGSQNTREIQYQWLVDKYGERCLICGKAPPEGQSLQIDEISYAPAEFDKPDNLSLVCNGCNCDLRPKDEELHRRIIGFHRKKRLGEIAKEQAQSARALKKGTAEGRCGIERIEREYRRARKKSGIDTPLPDFATKTVLEYMNGSSEMKANAKYQPDFAKYAWSYLMEHGPVPEKALLNKASAAISGHPSQTTLKRYIDWMYEIEGGGLAWDESTGERVVYFKNAARAQKASLGLDRDRSLGLDRDKSLDDTRDKSLDDTRDKGGKA